MAKRHVTRFAFLIDQHRMALRKGAARGILAREAHGKSFVEEGAEGERLRRGPVDALAALERPRFCFELARDGAMEMKVLRNGGERTSHGTKRRFGHGGLAAAIALGCRGKPGPAAVEPVGTVGAVRFCRFEFGI